MKKYATRTKEMSSCQEENLDPQVQAFAEHLFLLETTQLLSFLFHGKGENGRDLLDFVALDTDRPFTVDDEEVRRQAIYVIRTEINHRIPQSRLGRRLREEFIRRRASDQTQTQTQTRRTPKKSP